MRRLVLGLSWSLLATWALAQPPTVTIAVDGVGAIRGDLAQGRDDAIRDALRRAVEQAVGIGIQGRTLMVDLQVVEDRVVGRTAGFVRSYRILNESRDDGLYRVTVEAIVDTARMIEDLEGFGALLRLSLGNPRVLVVAAEGAAPGQAAAVRGLTERLVERQFLVLSREQLATLRTVRDPRALTAAELSALARTVDADLLITVVADSEIVGTQELGRGSLVSVRTGVELQAVLASTGQIIASTSADRTRASTTERLAEQEAAGLALASGFETFLLTTVRVLNTAASDLGTALSLQVVVHGIAGLGELLSLRDAVAQTRGVASVQQRRFEGGTAQFDVQGHASTEDVAVRLASEVGADRVRLDYLDAQRLELTLVPDP